MEATNRSNGVMGMDTAGENICTVLPAMETTYGGTAHARADWDIAGGKERHCLEQS